MSPPADPRRVQECVRDCVSGARLKEAAGGAPVLRLHEESFPQAASRALEACLCAEQCIHGSDWIVHVEYAKADKTGEIVVRRLGGFGVATVTVRFEGWYAPGYLKTGSRRIRCTFPIEGEVFVRVDRLSPGELDYKAYYSAYIHAKKPLAPGIWEELVELAKTAYSCAAGHCACEEVEE